MFKVLVLFALIAVAYSAPLPSTQPEEDGEVPNSEIDSTTDVTVNTINEINPEKEQLEGAEFGWFWKKWEWDSPTYAFVYPSYQPFYDPSPSYYPYWW